MMEGDLLEVCVTWTTRKPDVTVVLMLQVSLDETHHLWRILQAANLAQEMLQAQAQAAAQAQALASPHQQPGSYPVRLSIRLFHVHNLLS